LFASRHIHVAKKRAPLFDLAWHAGPIAYLIDVFYCMSAESGGCR